MCFSACKKKIITRGAHDDGLIDAGRGGVKACSCAWVHVGAYGCIFGHVSACGRTWEYVGTCG